MTENLIEQIVGRQLVLVELVGLQFGAGGLGDDACRDALSPGVGVQAFRQLVDVGLQHVADQRQAPAHVAVQCAVSSGKLRLVSRRQREVPKSVTDGHDEIPADARLNVLARQLVLSAAERLGQGLLKGEVHRLDGHDLVVDPEVLSQHLGVGEGVVRAVAAWHGQCQDILRSERIGRQRGDHGRVDSAGKPQHHTGEPALLDVIPQAQFQCTH